MSSIIELIKKAAIDAVKASNPTSILYGTVVGTHPLKVSIEQRLTLDSDHLLLTDNVRDYSTDLMLLGGATQNYTLYNSLEKGEQVLLLQVQGGQKYVILNRLVKA
ncbi:MAG: hypothetical protein K0S75_2380 [Clostridia bacterium]|nr:hypothetical protein [Clostridia bacterium]